MYVVNKIGLIFSVFILSNIYLSAQEQGKAFEYNKDKENKAVLLPREYDIFYEEKIDRYVIRQKAGDTYVGNPMFLTKEGYIDFILTGKIKDFFLDKSRAYDEAYKKSKTKKKNQTKDIIGVLPSFSIKSKWFEKIFGSNKLEIIPSGFASFDLGVYNQYIGNPNLLPNKRNNFSIDINQRIQFGLTGKIGDRISIGANYDTRASFGFENQIKLGWKGDEDDVVQNVEMGNVSFPLSTNLITGVQSLFGVRTDFKFGRTNVSTVFSNQQSQSNTIQVQGGESINTFKFSPIDYDLNQHYFLGQYYRNKYDFALSQYPIIKSLINITKAEVWKIDYTNSDLINQRAIVAIRDLGEEDSSVNPKNGTIYNQVIALGGGIREQTQARTLLNQQNINGTTYVDGEHFVVHRKVKKLAESEYTIQPQTGYISLTQPLDDKELLGVAYQYNVIGSNQVHQVGEFSTEQQGVLVVKLLKSNSTVNTTSPLWNLMMKNVYSVGNAINISPQDFIFNIKYQSPVSGAVDYFLSGPAKNKRFLNIFNLDKLNANNQSTTNNLGDGFFDFLPGFTINPTTGKILFTQVEPFGSNLQSVLSADVDATKEYVFSELYSKQKIEAKSSPLANRYFFDGKYKGDAADGISLGAINVPKGSVKVTANGQDLVEGSDYIVDYQLGRVTIINQVLKNSKTPISVSTENNALFNLQKKNFFGLNIEHKFSEDFILGATIANYGERPLTQKAQYGTESVSNTMAGMNVMWKTDAPFLSRLADKIPFARTEGKSSIQLNAEAAYLIPGTKNTIQDQSYIDDFETSQSKINLKSAFGWRLASTPQSNPLFPNGNALNSLQYGHQRGLLSWYEIDPNFYSINKENISADALLKNKSRRVQLNEIYTNLQQDVNTPSYLSTFDISYYPQERGPYNFNTALELPQSRWAGLSTALNVTNFESANIQYLEFWMMDPFSDGDTSNGELVVHLGNVSEDVLYDNQLLYENGLPSSNTTNTVENTNWGSQPTQLPILYSFTTQGAERDQQDIGYDGLGDAAELAKFNFPSINPVTGNNDPSGDNYLNYLDNSWNVANGGNSIIDRYKYFQGTQGNSPTNSNIQTSYFPDTEDLNQDFNLDQTESYYEYKVRINPSDLTTLGSNYVVDKKNVSVSLPDGSTTSTKWYQFRIPVSQGTPIGGINNLTSVRYMRLIMKDFSTQTTLRFGSLDLVRADWTPYTKKLFPATPTEGLDNQNISDTELSIANIEENGNRQPPYVVPPGIAREQLSSTTSNNLQQNEQSLSIKTNNLTADSRGVFKKSNFDIRRYKKIKMFVHAEDLAMPTSGGVDPDMKAFIRLGSDLVDNYYEYEVALKYTPNSARSAGEIWPDQNTLDFAIQDLISAKTTRDAMANLTTLLSQRFEQATADPNKKIFVKGRPSIGMVSNIMIGVRNSGNNPKNVLVWFNELRLAEIESKGGYATQGNVTFNLADLANFNLSGKYTSVGFGSINQGPTQRSQEENISYALATNINVDKFFPKKWYLTLPLSYSFSKNIINPEYNLLDTDVKFDAISNLKIKEVVQQVQTTRTIGVSNAKKNVSPDKKSKPAFYDIENFSTSFTYSDTNSKDIQIQNQLSKQLNIALNYTFSANKKEFRPFEKLPLIRSEMGPLKWLKEFNISPIPSQISFRTDINRNYDQTDYRDVASLLNNIQTTIPINTTFGNKFLFNWQYAVGFDLTRSFKLNYQTNTQSLVNNNLLKANENIIWDGLLATGKPIDHAQTITANYAFPTMLVPLIDWTSLDFNYTGKYNWRNNSQIFSDANLGYIIQNASTLNTNLGIDLNRFYPKLLDGIKSEYDSIKTARKSVLDGLRSKLDAAKTNAAYKNLLNKKLVFKSKLKPKHYLYSLLTAPKNITINHTLENGSTLPGFLLEPSLLGLTNSAPSLAYIIGSEFDIKKKALEQGWVTTSNLLTNPYAKNFSQNINATVLLEPIEELQLNMVLNNTYTESSSEVGFNSFSTNGVIGEVFNNQLISYNTSYLSVATAFNRGSVFNNFVDITKQFSNRLGAVDSNADGFKDGYNITNSAVLIPAFEAALKGQGANTASLKYKNNIPLPNWDLNYTGLTGIPWITKKFSQVNLKHAYQSNYIVSGIQANPNYFAYKNGTLPPPIDGSDNKFDENGNFHNEFLYQSVSLTETFSPLIGIDLKLRNRIQLTSLYNRGRITTLGLTNYSVTEDFMDEVVIGGGYTFKDVKLNLKFGRKTNKMKGDLLLRTDFSFIKKQGKIYNFLENTNTIIDGQDIYSIKFSADYSPAQNLMLKFFYNQLITKYNISTLFPSDITRAGINITFNIVSASTLNKTNNNDNTN